MKKIYALLTSFALAGTLSAQVYLEKNFNDTSITSGGWTNYSVVSTEEWYGDDFGGDVFAKITNYNGSTIGNVEADVWMISPAVDLSAANTPMFSFETVTNYAGDQLEVYVSTDYDGSSDPSQQGTWTALSPTLPTNTSSWSPWTSSGNLDLSSYISATTYVGFRYIGTDSDGKTWEVDNIQIVETVTGPSLSVSSTDATCGGSQGTATVTVVSGTTPYTYIWDNGSTDATATGLSQGSYTVTVEDATASPTTIVAMVGVSNGPVVTVSTTMATCNGDADGTATATGGQTDYTYAWQGGATGSAVSGLIAGAYSYTVTDGAGCTSSAMFTITEPDVIVVSASTTNETAFGAMDGSATASATGGDGSYAYEWENGTMTAALTGMAEGTYMVTVTDGNNCTGTASVTIDPDYLAMTSIYEIQYTSASNGDSPLDGTEVMTKGVVSGYCTYNNTNAGRNYRGYFIQDGDSAWSGLFVNDTINYDQVNAGDTVVVVGTIDEGQYPYWDYTMMHSISSFTLLDTTGSEPTAVAVTTLEANEEKYEGMLVKVSDTEVNDVTNLQYGEWVSSDGTGDVISGNLMYWHSPDPQIGERYNVTGVMFSEFNDIILEPRRPSDVTFAGINSIEELAQQNGLVYPNPTSGIITIEVEGQTTVTITNALGQIVRKHTITNGNMMVDLSNQSKGMYFVTLRSADATVVEKVMVK